MTAALLDGIDLFRILSPDERAGIWAEMEAVALAAGEVVVSAGEPFDGLYLVAAGQIRIVGRNGDGDEISLGKLQSSDHFGEMFMLGEDKSEFTYWASTEAVVRKWDKSGFEALANANPQFRKYAVDFLTNEAMRAFLQRSTLMAPMNHQELRSLLDRIEVIRYRDGEPIVTEGEEGDAFFIIRSGYVEVLKESEGGRLVNLLNAGDFFGELALLTGEPRRATVRASGPVTVFRLGKTDFAAIIEKFPKIKDTLISASSAYFRPSPSEEKGPPVPVIVPQPDDNERAKAFVQQEENSIRASPRRIGLFPRYPVLIQQNVMDCGPACLAMAARYYGKRLSMRQLRDWAGVDKDGTTLYRLAGAAEEAGFETESVKTGLDGLKSGPLPAIAHWKGNHYIVIYRANDRWIMAADPAIGLQKLDIGTFLEGWTGTVLFLRPTERLRSRENAKLSYTRYLPYLAAHKKALFSIALLSLALQAAGLALPLFTQTIIDRVLDGDNFALLNGMLGGMLLLSVLLLFLRAFRQYGMTSTFMKIDTAMIMSFIKHVLGLPMSYFASRRIADTITRVGENRYIRQFLTSNLMNAFMDMLTIVVYLIVMFIYDYRLAGIALAFIPLLIALAVLITPLMKLNGRKQFLAGVDMQNAIMETVGSIATVKALGAEATARSVIEDKLRRTVEVELNGTRLDIWSGSAGSVLGTLSSVAIMYAGAHLVMGGNLTVGQLIAFSAVYAVVVSSALNLIGVWDEVQHFRIAIERLDDVFEARQEEEPGEKRLIAPALTGGIAMEKVGFRYAAEGSPVLRHVDLRIEAGQTVAIVGRSGSGKSTLAHLLLKLYRPTSGTIRMDGIDISLLEASSLRRQIGIVQQENVLFNCSVKENIAYHHPQATSDEIKAAAMLAGAHEFISALPLGYDTHVGERGASLSGGQRQRIAIARALLGNPPILIFDEATSSLDYESERIIQRNMERILRNRTTLIIAHRLSTVREADKIVLLHEGEIAESGTHEELLVLNGLYCHLLRQQIG